MKTEILNKELMLKHLEEILKIESDTSNRLGIKTYGRAWTSENFLSNRNGKWEYSTCVLENDSLVAFLISSRWLNNLHGHRMAMQIDFSKEKKINLQKNLYVKQREILELNSVYMTTAIVPEDNISTIRFYKKEGWEDLSKQELVQFIEGREMDCHIGDNNILIDNSPEEGHPSRSRVLKFLTLNRQK